MRRLTLALALALGGILVAPQMAQAHVERPSYWPDPNPDCSISPCAGGEIPTARSLASALTASTTGTTRVVCKPNSLDLASRRRSVMRSPTATTCGPPITAASAAAQAQRPAGTSTSSCSTRCRYDEIQPAITDSGNNDRVVVMPGVYTEPTAASQPTYDPACAQYTVHSDSGDPGALSHTLPGASAPTTPTWSRSSAGASARAPTPTRLSWTGTASRTPARASGATCRSRAPGSAPTTSSSRPVTRRPATADRPRSDTRRTSASSSTAPTGFVFRKITIRHAT